MLLVSAERLVTTGEAARALNVHPRTFRRWLAYGWITPTDVTGGGHYRWRVADVRQQLRERHTRADAAPPFSPELADTPRHPEEPR